MDVNRLSNGSWELEFPAAQQLQIHKERERRWFVGEPVHVVEELRVRVEA